MIVRSLRVRLLLLFLLAVMPVLVLTLITNIEQRQLATQDAREEALRLIELATSQHEHFINGAHQLLIALAQLPSVRSRDDEVCSALFSDLFKQYPFYATLGAADLDGNSYCSPLRATGPVNIADRIYFRNALETGGLSIGDYAVGRRSGKASLHFGYPILDKEGKTQGVVFVALDLRWLGELAAQMRLALGTTLTLFDRSGIILARYPVAQNWTPGISAANASLFEIARVQVGKGIVETQDLNAVPSLFVFAPIGSRSGTAQSDIAVYLAVGTPAAAAFAGANFIFARNLLVIGVIASFALALAWWFSRRFILRPVAALRRTMEAVQQGNLQARTGLSSGPDELGQLATAFDRMTGQLQTRELELNSALARTVELKNLLDSIFDSIMNGVITTDLQGNITLSNGAALRILGYSDAGDLAGRNVADLRAPLGSTLLPYLYRVGQTDEPIIGIETSIQMPQKGTLQLRFNISTLKGPARAQGIAIVVDDVTENRRMAAQWRLLQHMVSPAILDQLDPECLQLGGKRTEITAVFADIHGFTGISEQLNPEDLVGLLNRYLAAMADAVLTEEGTIDKFLGDAVMAWFNAPLPQRDHVLRAVRAALGIRDAIATLHEEVSPLFRLSFGVGIHVGEAVLGLVGTHKRLEYTAIGDDINIAKRIQEHTGASQILMSAAVYDIVKDQVVVRPVPAIQAKGKQKPIEVYELIDLRR